MTTLTANTVWRYGEHCPHKLPTSCRLTARPICCACQDNRPHAPMYRKYIDGVGFVMLGNRQDGYCYPCKTFWDVRIAAAGMEPRDARIPFVPDQHDFVNTWRDWHEGFRYVVWDNGTVDRVPLHGTPLALVDIGYLPIPVDGGDSSDDRAYRHLARQEMPELLRPRQQEVIEVPDEDRLFDSDAEDESAPSTVTAQPRSDNIESNTHLLRNPPTSNTITQTLHPSNVQTPTIPPHTFTHDMLAQAHPIATRNQPHRRTMDGPEAFRESLHRLIPHIRSATDSVGSTLDLPELGEAHLTVLRNTLASLHELSEQVTLSYELLHTSTLNEPPITAPRTISIPLHPLLATHIQATSAGQNNTRNHVRGIPQTTTEQDDSNRRLLIQQETALTASTQRTAEALHQATAMMNARAAAHGRTTPQITILGTREEVQQPNYVSPINLMFDRAERSARRVEEERRQALLAHERVEEARRQAEASRQGPESRRLRYPITPNSYAPMGRHRRFPSFHLGRRRSHGEETSNVPQANPLTDPHGYLTSQLVTPLPELSTQQEFQAPPASNTIERQEETQDIRRDPSGHAQFRQLRSSLERLEQQFNYSTQQFEQGLTTINGRIARHASRHTEQLTSAERPLESSEMLVQLQCTICQEQIADIALVPCGHLVMCRWCSATHERNDHEYEGYRAGSKCPLCRAHIVQRLRIWGVGGGSHGASA